MILILLMLWMLMQYRNLQLEVFILVFFMKLRTTFLQKKLKQEKLISDIRQWYHVRKTKISLLRHLALRVQVPKLVSTLLLLFPQCIYKSLEPKRLRSLAKEQQGRVREDIQNFSVCSWCTERKKKKSSIYLKRSKWSSIEKKENIEKDRVIMWNRV